MEPADKEGLLGRLEAFAKRIDDCIRADTYPAPYLNPVPHLAHFDLDGDASHLKRVAAFLGVSDVEVACRDMKTIVCPRYESSDYEELNDRVDSEVIAQIERLTVVSSQDCGYPLVRFDPDYVFDILVWPLLVCGQRSSRSEKVKALVSEIVRIFEWANRIPVRDAEKILACADAVARGAPTAAGPFRGEVGTILFRYLCDDSSRMESRSSRVRVEVPATTPRGAADAASLLASFQWTKENRASVYFEREFVLTATRRVVADRILPVGTFHIEEESLHRVQLLEDNLRRPRPTSEQSAVFHVLLAPYLDEVRQAASRRGVQLPVCVAGTTPSSESGPHVRRLPDETWMLTIPERLLVVISHLAALVARCTPLPSAGAPHQFSADVVWAKLQTRTDILHDLLRLRDALQSDDWRNIDHRAVFGARVGPWSRVLESDAVSFLLAHELAHTTSSVAAPGRSTEEEAIADAWALELASERADGKFKGSPESLAMTCAGAELAAQARLFVAGVGGSKSSALVTAIASEWTERRERLFQVAEKLCRPGEEAPTRYWLRCVCTTVEILRDCCAGGSGDE